ncbi:histone-lysine N-methyltransferase SETMAR-like [Dermacentor andersoni]|uniref:histone-lysine N-methyltransferase SETMAR-like n=1 Tax=Dermacentor andersoni TaxID=34620 RepID=UPI002416A9AB|nr:histone-lysine N-methyltransferase SETMAR-like [Dermacentor andersoni]
MMKAGRRVHLKDICWELGNSYGSAYDSVHGSLGYRKVSCRWVPKQLDDMMKGKQMIASLNHLQWYAEEGESFLDSIVTGDEMWILHFTPELKEQCMVWENLGSAVTKNSIHWLLGSVLRDCRGPLLLDFMPQGVTINADSYCSTPSRLLVAIRRKRRGILDVDDAVTLHDNARPYVAIITTDKLWSFYWESLDQPPYSPDFAPSAFHVFGPLKKFLAGQRFTCNDEAKTSDGSSTVSRTNFTTGAFQI